MDKQLIGRCGAYCGSCEWKDRTNCPGCQQCNGNPFWGQCTMAKCSIEKGYHHCGQCSKLPCDELQSAFDNPDHGDNGERLVNLKNWAAGKEDIMELTRPEHKEL